MLLSKLACQQLFQDICPMVTQKQLKSAQYNDVQTYNDAPSHFSIDKTLSLWKFIICCLIRALRICTRTVVNKDKQRRIQILKGCKIYDLRGNMWYWSKIWPHFNFDRLVCLVQVVQNTALGLSSFHDENHVSRTLLDTSLTGVDCNHCTGSNARGSLDCFENICATFSLM